MQPNHFSRFQIWIKLKINYPNSLIAAWNCNWLNEHTVWKMRIFIFTDEATIQDSNNNKKKFKWIFALVHQARHHPLSWPSRTSDSEVGEKAYISLCTYISNRPSMYNIWRLKAETHSMTHRLRAKLPRYLTVNNTCDACFATPLSKHITYGTASRYRPRGAQLALQCPLLRGARQHRNYWVTWEHLSCDVMLCAPEHQPEEGKA